MGVREGGRTGRRGNSRAVARSRFAARPRLEAGHSPGHAACRSGQFLNGETPFRHYADDHAPALASILPGPIECRGRMPPISCAGVVGTTMDVCCEILGGLRTPGASGTANAAWRPSETVGSAPPAATTVCCEILGGLRTPGASGTANAAWRPSETVGSAPPAATTVSREGCPGGGRAARAVGGPFPRRSPS